MNKIVVVDFDGCLCAVNSFRYWLFFSFFCLFLSLRWKLFLRFNKCILSRVLGKCDRVEMKRCVLSVTEQLPHYQITLFCRFLNLFINSDVVSEIHKYSKEEVVLCTAAPGLYVDVFAESFNFSKVFATSSVSKEDWKENIGSEKLEVLTAFYGEDVVFSCVITDHFDDLPLLLRADRRILVRPSSLTLERIADKFQYDML